MRLTYEYGARFEKTGYEPAVHLFLTERAKPGSVVFDVGAHVGVLTIALAQRVGETGHVYAFEPAPATAAVLRRHVAMNKLDDRVTVIEAVVSEVEGRLDLHVYGESMAASLSRDAIELSPEVFEEPPEAISVVSTTLDAVAVREGRRPTLVKIDVEGAELRVLRGMRTLLADRDVTVVCEVHPTQLAAMGGTVEEIDALVAEHGRSVVPLTEPNAMGIRHAVFARS
jgi:FkbM family methyltransferase